MSATPAFDHIALTVPDLDRQVERLTNDLGMEVRSRFERFALLVDPRSGITFELGRSGDGDVHVRHLGFVTEDVDGAHRRLVDSGMTTNEAPHHRDVAGMYTSYLAEPGGVEVQLVRYD